MLLLCLARAAVADDAGLLGADTLAAEALTQWRLPDKLNEISGLASTADGRLLAVADEAAIVYELDTSAGRLEKAFAYGDPVLRGDFEGIAVLGDLVYLLTSDGNLVRGAEGADGERVAYKRIDTGLGGECEFEGLAQQRELQRLLIACKRPKRRGRFEDPAIFVWSAERGALLPDEAIRLPLADILRRLRTDRLNPSGLAVDPVSGHLLLLASRQRALIELTADGRLLRADLLAATRHRQPEGIEVTRDGRLLIADEGGSHKARLGIYAPAEKRAAAP